MRPYCANANHPASELRLVDSFIAKQLSRSYTMKVMYIEASPFPVFSSVRVAFHKSFDHWFYYLMVSDKSSDLILRIPLIYFLPPPPH